MHKKKGFTKAWRDEIDGRIWNMPPMYHRIWFYLRQKASWKINTFPTGGRYDINLLPGQLITSLSDIADGVSYSERRRIMKPTRKTILKILNWLECNGSIFKVSNTLGTFITIVNWDTYNGIENEVVNTQDTTSDTTSDTNTDTLLKKYKEVKEIKRSKDKESGAKSIAPAPSPGQIARLFFDMHQGQIERTDFYWNYAGKLPADELDNFVMHWTEPTKSGKRELWETKASFELSRRMATWQRNIDKFARNGKARQNTDEVYLAALAADRETK